MAKVVPFPQSSPTAAQIAMQNIEKRFGVSFLDFMASQRSEETQERIDRALRKETMRIQ
ncbi:hypothetical protein [Paenibacillus dendritiformis]|uniref:hypothetical protein n=1 Tax=Paenibacillus dendritiformis TaxID=130049 RepID=UPI0015EB6EA4|nr:hypothetical protein [Paenibacillus dendritiformis]